MDEILDYWFEYSPSNIAISQQLNLSSSFSRWFGGQEDDAQHAIWNSLETKANGWPDIAEGQLARVILYDQIPRGCFRGAAQAFAYDEVALYWANRFLAAAHPSPMGLTSPTCLSHMLMILICLSHSEKVEVQQRSLDLSAHFSQGVLHLSWLNPKIKGELSQVHVEAQQHYDVVQAFGRFPHRNQILNRESTLEEQQFLQSALLPNWMRSQSLEKRQKTSVNISLEAPT